MSGHSKWANIRRRKEAVDAKKGSVFTKIIKEISVAVKESGPDPDANPRLRLAIQNARGANMPKDNIERAIKKASGEGAENYSEVTYEGYGPNGVAVFVECLTNNPTRTVANVRHHFNKSGGSMGTSGSVDYLFERKGVFSIVNPNRDIDELTLDLIDGGADELEETEDNLISVYTQLENFGQMQTKLDELKIEIKSAELQRLPLTTVKLDDEQVLKVMKLIDLLEEDDDVQKVYHNLELTESQYELDF